MPVHAQAPETHAPASLRGGVDEATAYLRAGRSKVLIGAATGLVVGVGATWLIVHSGGSTSLCDRDANQDALNSTECFGIVALGGLVGAGIGALIGHLLTGDDTGMRMTSMPPLRVLPIAGRRPGLHVDVSLRPFMRGR